jgi:hypothetical protein
MKCPFWNHESYLDYCVRNMRRGQDNVHLYDGEEGSGKSNGAAWDAIKIHERLGKVYDVVNDPIFNRPQWNDRFDAAEKERVYVLDEFENVAFNRDFNRPDNKEFIKLAQQARILRSTILAVMPYLQFADVYFRQGRFRVRVQYERVTDYDLPCYKCGYDHEIREAVYKWRQRSEDPETGEVQVRWEEIFTARHCPLALVRPLDWKGYEDRKEASVRETALGRKRGKEGPEEAGVVAAIGNGRSKEEPKRRAMWGTLSKKDRVLALAYAQDAIRKASGQRKREPLTPTKASNTPRSRKRDPESLFNGEPIGDFKPRGALGADGSGTSPPGVDEPRRSGATSVSRPRKRSTRA